MIRHQVFEAVKIGYQVMYTIETALLKLSYFIDVYLIVKGALTLKMHFKSD